MKAKAVVGKLLMAFLLVSVGVVIGKQMATPGDGPAVAAAAQGEKVVVYYMHGIPCVTCTFIETTTETLVAEEFADAVKAGRMEFTSLSYLEPANAALAEKYNVGSNMVIAARFVDGREVEHVRLDRVMELAHSADELKAYLREGIASTLEGVAK